MRTKYIEAFPILTDVKLSDSKNGVVFDPTTLAEAGTARDIMCMSKISANLRSKEQKLLYSDLLSKFDSKLTTLQSLLTTKSKLHDAGSTTTDGLTSPIKLYPSEQLYKLSQMAYKTTDEMNWSNGMIDVRFLIEF